MFLSQIWTLKGLTLIMKELTLLEKGIILNITLILIPDCEYENSWKFDFGLFWTRSIFTSFVLVIYWA